MAWVRTSNVCNGEGQKTVQHPKPLSHQSPTLVTLVTGTAVNSLPGDYLQYFPGLQMASCISPQVVLAPELWGSQDLGQGPLACACSRRGSPHPAGPQGGPDSADRRWLQSAPPVSWTCPWVNEANINKASKQQHYGLEVLSLVLSRDSDKPVRGSSSSALTNNTPNSPTPRVS